MTTATIGPATTTSGAPIPVVALPQGELLTVNVEQIPELKDLVGPGIHIQPLRIDPERGEWVFLSRLAPGCELPLHYHTGTAQVWTIQGRWEYKEYPGQPQTAGSYLYEPGGSVHTFFTPADNTEDTIALAWIEGAQVSFNEDGTFHSVMDGVTLQFLIAMAAAQGAGPVPYIGGGSARVTEA
jgi:2,4'-dihydroxyacetophenone dioxygenase